MKISKEGLEFLAEVEGNKLVAYRDTGGVLTIGVGHTSDEHLEVTPGLKITHEKSMELLAIDVEEAEEVVKHMVSVPLTQHQFDALVSFVFNLGPTQFANSTLLRKLNGWDYVGAANQFKRWVYDNGKIQPGLVKRRYGEAEMFRRT